MSLFSKYSFNPKYIVCSIDISLSEFFTSIIIKFSIFVKLFLSITSACWIYCWSNWSWSNWSYLRWRNRWSTSSSMIGIVTPRIGIMVIGITSIITTRWSVWTIASQYIKYNSTLSIINIIQKFKQYLPQPPYGPVSDE